MLTLHNSTKVVDMIKTEPPPPINDCIEYLIGDVSGSKLIELYLNHTLAMVYISDMEQAITLKQRILSLSHQDDGKYKDLGMWVALWYIPNKDHIPEVITKHKELMGTDWSTAPIMLGMNPSVSKQDKKLIHAGAKPLWL